MFEDRVALTKEQLQSIEGKEPTSKYKDDIVGILLALYPKFGPNGEETYTWSDPDGNEHESYQGYDAVFVTETGEEVIGNWPSKKDVREPFDEFGSGKTLWELIDKKVVLHFYKEETKSGHKMTRIELNDRRAVKVSKKKELSL